MQCCSRCTRPWQWHCHPSDMASQTQNVHKSSLRGTCTGAPSHPAKAGRQMSTLAFMGYYRAEHRARYEELLKQVSTAGSLDLELP